MKPLPLMLAVTVLAHTFLGLLFWFRTPVPTVHPRPPSASASTVPVASAPLPQASVNALGTAYAANDARSVRDLLLAAGLSLDSVRNTISAMLYEQHQTQIDALSQAASRTAVWWRDLTPEELQSESHSAQLDRLHEKIQNELDSLFPETNAASAHDTDDDPELAFLPPAKQKAFLQITRDYGEMIEAANLAAGRFELPADREKITFLEAERDRDIAAILTREEREALELRTSPRAYQLRSLMTGLKATEAEYRAIFALQKACETRDAELDVADTELAQQNLQNQIATLVGIDRYRAYARTEDTDYTSLQAIAERFSIPPAIIDTLYNIREPIAQTTQRIAHDPGLDISQKASALQALALQTRQQITAALGPEVTAAYLQQNMSWLGALEAGHVLSVQPAGNLLATPLRLAPIN